MSMRLIAGLVLSWVIVAGVACDGSGKGSVDDTDIDTDRDTDTDIDTVPGDDTDEDTDTTDTIVETDTDQETDTDLFESDTDGLADSGDTSIDTFAPHTGGILPHSGGGGGGGTGDSGGGGGPGPGPIGETAQGCPPLQVIDCEGVCANELLVGDGTCHDGVAFGQPNFDCPIFDNDGGDCGSDTDDLPCGDPLEIRDCEGFCYPQTWIGDGSCDDGTSFPHGSPDFECELFTWDGGDCPTDTDLLP